MAVDRFSFERGVRRPIVENELDQKARMLALVLATFADGRTGVARVSRTKLMESCVWKDRKSLTAHVRILEKAGFLAYQPGGRGRSDCSVYQLMLPAHLVSGEVHADHQASPAPADDVNEVKEAALLLYAALEVHGEQRLCDRIKSEHDDWPRLREAVIAQLRRGWDLRKLLMQATAPPSIDAGAVRNVCRLYASRVDRLGPPATRDQYSSGTVTGAAQLRTSAEFRARLIKAQDRLIALGPDRVDQLASCLSHPLQALYRDGGMDPVALPLVELLDGGGLPDLPTTLTEEQQRLRAVCRQRLAILSSAEVDVLAVRLDASMYRVYQRRGPVAVEEWLIRALANDRSHLESHAPIHSLRTV
ncbi:hypothetical protein GCM10010435_89260 [Winogradskya consettensis]|uniref:Uncharacterized protein n=1 Tax=Winogradskya consettensis TaxID=113560 RepID=A0A919VV90_9ACTN|nr:hypothetical protein [Actinoplanes consettensis]GIM77097.1 hypothetical protein Aco04nite_53720 [Actinoplanes consettensis]